MATSIALAAGTVTSLAGCDGSDDATADADTYTAVVAHFLDDDPAPPVADGEQRPVVFVMSLVGEPLALDDQVVVIDRFVESHDLRFVDDLDAALDPEVADAPPRDAGLLIGIGQITFDQPSTIRVELYSDATAVAAHLLTVAERGDAWVITADEPVDPEVLGGGA